MGKILTINPGSTSVKYDLFDTENNSVLDSAIFDRKEGSKINPEELNWIKVCGDLIVISIRVVHGGGLKGPIVFNTDVKLAIYDAQLLAPIHNKIALQVINTIQELYDNTPIVINFDTDFHVDMPDVSRIYPIKRELTESLDIRRYGFHGIVLQSILEQVKEKYNGIPQKMICIHLGGGSSITAIKNSKSIDTTMGLTPLEGIMMITRSGSIGPGVIEYISKRKGWSVEKIIDMLNDESGFYGMTGTKNTVEIIKYAIEGTEPYKLAFDIYFNQIIKRVYSYYGVLQGCDLITLSGGIGYGNAFLQSRLLKELALMNITKEKLFITETKESEVLYKNAKTMLGL